MSLGSGFKFIKRSKPTSLINGAGTVGFCLYGEEGKGRKVGGERKEGGWRRRKEGGRRREERGGRREEVGREDKHY